MRTETSAVCAGLEPGRTKIALGGLAILVLAAAAIANLARISSAASPAESSRSTSADARSSNAFVDDLRRSGLDVVLVIDGTGSIDVVTRDIKSKIANVAAAIQQIVPGARLGVVEFGARQDPRKIQPLTASKHELQAFAGTLVARPGNDLPEDTIGACDYAIEKSDWRPDARKVIILVGDSPPARSDQAPLDAAIRQFRARNGIFNAIDVAEVEHERFERAYWRKLHGEDPPTISPLPGFYRQTRAAYGVLADAGGGTAISLRGSADINQQMLILLFGKRFAPEIAPLTSRADQRAWRRAG